MTLPTRICDPHHHLWLSEGLEYLPPDLYADIATVPEVVKTVFVECDAWYRTTGPDHLRVIGETEWVVEHGGPVIAGIVGSGDLRLGPRTDELLDAHVAAGDGRFRGIRHRATWDADPGIRPSFPYPGEGMLRDPWFRRGFERLHAMGLGFDAWVYFPQLPDLVDLAQAFPDTPIVLNHLGAPITLGPYRDVTETRARWRTHMADLAPYENVFVKLGGIGMPMLGGWWHRSGCDAPLAEVVEFWSEPISFCIDTFGPDRCMFESNFSVDKISMSYATLWAAFDAMSAEYSPTERDALFHDTAVRAYRL